MSLFLFCVANDDNTILYLPFGRPRGLGGNRGEGSNFPRPTHSSSLASTALRTLLHSLLLLGSLDPRLLCLNLGETLDIGTLGNIPVGLLHPLLSLLFIPPPTVFAILQLRVFSSCLLYALLSYIYLS